MKKFGLILVSVLIVLPSIAFAAQPCTGGGLGEMLCRIGNLLNVIIPILITLGVVYFIWGVIQYVTAKDEEKQKEARSTMIYGIIGLAVIVSVWGLVGVLQKTFGLTTQKQEQFPTVTLPSQ